MVDTPTDTNGNSMDNILEAAMGQLNGKTASMRPVLVLLEEHAFAPRLLLAEAVGAGGSRMFKQSANSPVCSPFRRQIRKIWILSGTLTYCHKRTVVPGR